MKKYVSILLIVFSASLLFAAKKKMPEWIAVPSSVYPSDVYLNGVGSGDSRESAALEAVKNLSAVFGQTVKSKTGASKKMEQAVAKGTVAFSSSSSLEQNITSSVDAENVIGISIAEYFYNKPEKKWYAIAVLHKKETAEIYKNLLKKNDGTVRQAVNEAKKDAHSFYAYSEICFAIEIADENDRLLKNLMIIDFDAGNALNAEIVSIESLRAMQKNIANNITIFTEIRGDKKNKIKSAFQDIFSQYGFKTSADSSLRYRISGEFSSEIVEKKAVYCVYTLDLDFVDTKDSKSLFAVNLKGREGSVSKSDAENRALRVLEKNIGTEFSGQFDSYINNLSF